MAESLFSSALETVSSPFAAVLRFAWVLPVAIGVSDEGCESLKIREEKEDPETWQYGGGLNGDDRNQQGSVVVAWGPP